jgi:hypothetical protein
VRSRDDSNPFDRQIDQFRDDDLAQPREAGLERGEHCDLKSGKF